MQARACRAFSEMRLRRATQVGGRVAVQQIEMASKKALAVHGHGGRHTALPPLPQTGSVHSGPTAHLQSLAECRLDDLGEGVARAV